MTPGQWLPAPPAHALKQNAQPRPRPARPDPRIFRSDLKIGRFGPEPPAQEGGGCRTKCPHPSLDGFPVVPELAARILLEGP